MSRRRKKVNTGPTPPYATNGPLATPSSYEVIQAVEAGAKIATDSFDRGLEAGKPKQPSKNKYLAQIAILLYALVLLIAVLVCLAQLLPKESLPEVITDKELAEKALTYVLAQLPLLAKIISEK
jgi:hypothetical protein